MVIKQLGRAVMNGFDEIAGGLKTNLKVSKILKEGAEDSAENAKKVAKEIGEKVSEKVGKRRAATQTEKKAKQAYKQTVKEAKTNVSKEAEEAASTPEYIKNYKDKTRFTVGDTHYRKYNDKNGNPVYEYKNRGEEEWSPILENHGVSPSKQYGHQKAKFIKEQEAMEEAKNIADDISKTATGDGDGIGLLDLASKHPIITGLSAFGLGYGLSDGDDYE